MCMLFPGRGILATSVCTHFSPLDSSYLTLCAFTNMNWHLHIYSYFGRTRKITLQIQYCTLLVCTITYSCGFDDPHLLLWNFRQQRDNCTTSSSTLVLGPSPRSLDAVFNQNPTWGDWGQNINAVLLSIDSGCAHIMGLMRMQLLRAALRAFPE